MSMALLSIFNSCQKDELEVGQLTDEVQPVVVVQPNVYVENGYLVFETKEAFDSIRFVIEKLSFEESIEWEKSLNFTSAKTEKYFAEEEALKIIDENDVHNFKIKYSQRFDVNDDLDINYKFYSKGLEDILNINGLVKIEKSLYKFSEDKEYIVLNGDYTMISDIESGLKSGVIENENVVVFDPTSTNNKLKSTDILDEGIKTVGIRRLIWSVEKYVFSTIVNFDPYTGLPTYSAGYELTLVMNQEKYRGIPKKWRNNEASYNLENQYIDWNEIGVAPTPGYTGWFQDDYIGTTRNTVKVHYISKLYYSSQAFYKDFALRDFRVTFWSSGILEENKISVDL
jgi:hypothetical protein